VQPGQKVKTKINHKNSTNGERGTPDRTNQQKNHKKEGKGNPRKFYRLILGGMNQKKKSYEFRRARINQMVGDLERQQNPP